MAIRWAAPSGKPPLSICISWTRCGDVHALLLTCSNASQSAAAPAKARTTHNVLKTTSCRFYRNSLVQLQRASAQFEKEQVSFAMHLGDIVDGKQKKAAQDAYNTATVSSMQALRQALDAFGQFQGRTYHVVGNHCLYNFTRPELYEQCVLLTHHLPPLSHNCAPFVLATMRPP